MQIRRIPARDVAHLDYVCQQIYSYSFYLPFVTELEILFLHKCLHTEYLRFCSFAIGLHTAIVDHINKADANEITPMQQRLFQEKLHIEKTNTAKLIDAWFRVKDLFLKRVAEYKNSVDLMDQFYAKYRKFSLVANGFPSSPVAQAFFRASNYLESANAKKVSIPHNRLTLLIEESKISNIPSLETKINAFCETQTQLQKQFILDTQFLLEQCI